LLKDKAFLNALKKVWGKKKKTGIAGHWRKRKKWLHTGQPAPATLPLQRSAREPAKQTEVGKKKGKTKGP